LTLLGTLTLTLEAAVSTRIEEVEEVEEDDAGIKMGLSETDPDKSMEEAFEEASDALQYIDSRSSCRFTPK